MEKKILLFNYFLQEVAKTEQKLLQLDDAQSALLAIIFSEAEIFRRHSTGCNTEKIRSCQTQYAEDLYWIVCLNAKANGHDLLKNYRLMALQGAQIVPQGGARILQEDAVHRHCYCLYPNSTTMQNVYTKLSPDCKNILGNRTVDMSQLQLPTPDEDTKAIDEALARLTQDEEFIKLFDVTNKYDIYGRSSAQVYYQKHYGELLSAI